MYKALLVLTLHLLHKDGGIRVPNKSSQARLGQTWLGLIKSSQTIKRLGSFLGTGVWPMFALCMP